MADERQVYSHLHKVLVDALDKAQSIDTWGNRGHEFKILREIEEKLIALHGDELGAADAGLVMLRAFYRKRKSGVTYWSEAPMTPNGWKKRWDDLIAIETSPTTSQTLTRAGSGHVADFLEAIQITYDRSYNAEMAGAIARMLGKPPARFLSALLDAVVGQFTPTTTRPLPDPAAINIARATLKQAGEYQDATELNELPVTCPTCHHPVRKFSNSEAICLGEYDERLHRKTGCGAEWQWFEGGWRQGYWRTVGVGEFRRSVWEDGVPHDLESNWRAQLAEGVPAVNATELIERGRKAEYARVNRRVDEGIASRDEVAWIEGYGKPRRSLPGVKHVADIVEANW